MHLFLPRLHDAAWRGHTLIAFYVAVARACDRPWRHETRGEGRLHSKRKVKWSGAPEQIGHGLSVDCFCDLLALRTESLHLGLVQVRKARTAHT